jgi:peptidoglycan/LPS O-acetylase OafA/YrhL
VINGVFSTLFSGNADYCSVLWCMNVIFFGSYLSYGVLLFFGALRRRFLFYILLFLLSFAAPMYTAFLGGIVAADIVASRPAPGKSSAGGALLALLGLLVGIFPSVWLPSPMHIFTLYGISCCLLLVGIGQTAFLRKMLCNRLLVYSGEISFGLILTHFTVLMSFSAWIFYTLHNTGMAYGAVLALTLATAVPVCAVLAILFKRFIERPTELFVKWIYRSVS